MGISRFWASAINILVPFVLAIGFYCGEGFHTAAACRLRIWPLGLFDSVPAALLCVLHLHGDLLGVCM